jgi:hypothetical protein
MLLVACAVVFELCLAAVLWRISRQRPSIATEISSIFIGFAGACSVGLATQGFFLFAVDALQVSQLAPTVFWLTSGAFAFAVALALKPSPASVSIPCMTLAALFLIYGILQHHAMAVIVGFVLTLSAIIVWSCARRIAPQSAQ